MATLTGQLGQVKIGNDSAGAETAIAEVRSWTVEVTKEVIENTSMGDASRTYLQGLQDFTGSMEVIYDTAHTTATKAFSPESNDDLFVDFITCHTRSLRYKFQPRLALPRSMGVARLTSS